MFQQGPRGRSLNCEGAILEPFFVALSTINPLLALGAGAALGALGTLAVVFWEPRKGAKPDPLSNLFEGNTLQSQIARVADHAARTEQADRDASAIRAKIFAKKAAKGSSRARPVPPHRAERYDHQAVLDHIAKVMRAGSELDKAPLPTHDGTVEEPWEEVLLLPAPAPSPSSRKAA